jgi:hypothetical protein
VVISADEAALVLAVAGGPDDPAVLIAPGCRHERHAALLRTGTAPDSGGL